MQTRAGLDVPSDFDKALSRTFPGQTGVVAETCAVGNMKESFRSHAWIEIISLSSVPKTITSLQRRIINRRTQHETRRHERVVNGECVTA